MSESESDLRCPRCCEDRQIERVTTGKTWVYLCAVCATSFPPPVRP